MINPITNHVQLALNRLITQYKSAQNLQNLLTGIVTPLQDIEDTLADMNSLRYLPAAFGAQLDLIGSIVGIARASGEDDASYLLNIYGQIKINSSEGQPEQMIQLYLLLTQADFVILDEGAIASFMLESDYQVPDQVTANQLITVLGQAKPVGTRIDGLVSFDPDAAFAFDGNLPGAGFGDLNDPTAGGGFSTLSTYGLEFAFDGDDENAAGFGDIHDPLVGGELVGL